MSIYVHNGKGFEEKSDAFMKHNGTKFEKAEVLKHNGKSWEEISQQTRTKIWESTWSQSYNGEDSNEVIYRTAKWGDTVSHYALWYEVTWAQIVNWNNLKSPHVISENVRYIVMKKDFPRQRKTGWLYQGRTPVNSKTEDRGRQRSMVGFDTASIQKELSGADIERVELYIKNQDTHNTSGGTAVIGYHNNNTVPNDFGQTKYGAKSEYFTKGTSKWVEMPKEFGELLRDNKAKGFTLFADNDNTKNFGTFHSHTSLSKPRIKITYKK